MVSGGLFSVVAHQQRLISGEKALLTFLSFSRTTGGHSYEDIGAQVRVIVVFLQADRQNQEMAVIFYKTVKFGVI